ncbi:S-adenosylmethionine-dependent methyltransferase, partial [Ascosphaera acerosa]
TLLRRAQAHGPADLPTAAPFRANMLPTPSTDHVSFRTVYEPAEDSFLFLDTLASDSESRWLHAHFAGPDGAGGAAPLLAVEVGPGSGVVLAFAAAHAQRILGRADLLALGVDVNRDACVATRETVRLALDSGGGGDNTHLLGTLHGDLCGALRPRSVDLLLFNPPYVPTPDRPQPPPAAAAATATATAAATPLDGMTPFERESYLLALAYAGGANGMEVTEALLAQVPAVLAPRGVAYVLFCKQNDPAAVQRRITAEIIFTPLI